MSLGTLDDQSNTQQHAYRRTGGWMGRAGVTRDDGIARWAPGQAHMKHCAGHACWTAGDRAPP